MSIDSQTTLLTEVQLNIVLEQAKVYAESINSSDSSQVKLCRDDSFIPVKSQCVNPGGRFLVLDVGGTHTRAALQLRENGQTTWKLLFDFGNKELRKGDSDTFSSACSAIAHFCKQELVQNGLNTVNGISVIWSNELASYPLKTDQIQGVSGLVAGKAEGRAYRKGEWWNESLKNGDDVGLELVKAFDIEGISPKVFVIGNDTIFTAKAVNSSDAGMVASTGANVTIVPRGGSTFCNSECGGYFILPDKGVNKEDYMGRSQVTLEELMTGLQMPRLFQSYLISYYNQGADELKSIIPLFQNDDGYDFFESSDLSKIANGEHASFLKKYSISPTDTRLVNRLSEIAKMVVIRGGQSAAIMVFISIYNQFPDSDLFVVALDSSQARYIPLYFDMMSNLLHDLMKKEGKRVDLQLLSPEGEVSVPMLGAANALGDFLSLSFD